jgi:hypothetical protein
MPSCCLVIEQRNYQCSEVCLIYLRVLLNYALLCAEYRVVNNLAINLEDISVQDLDNFHILSYDSRVRAPEWKIVTHYTHCRVDPKNPTYGLMF